jgi:putative transposase
MTTNKSNNTLKLLNLKELFNEDKDLFKEIVQSALQEILEAEMNETINANKNERISCRIGYRCGYYTRDLITRVGKIELRVPRDREGLFSTEIFNRYQRSEKALVSTLMEMYINGVSTRKISRVTEELCGHSFSAGTISNLNKTLDEQLNEFSNRKLEESYPYLFLDASYYKVRENGIVQNRAVLKALGVNWEGRRQILAIELSNRETKSGWKDFIIRLKERGLNGVEFVVSDNHEGLKNAISETLPQAIWQRCYVHFLRNALDYLPRKKQVDDVLLELRWIYERINLNESKRALKLWLTKWNNKYSKLCEWVEENIEETLSFYHLPRQHRKNMKSTNVLERLNEEMKRRTYVLRIFPNPDSCLRLLRALAVEIQEFWIERNRYLNMDFLREHKKYSDNKRLDMTA